jgi:hypothetical protein
MLIIRTCAIAPATSDRGRVSALMVADTACGALTQSAACHSLLNKNQKTNSAMYDGEYTAALFISSKE